MNNNDRHSVPFSYGTHPEYDQQRAGNGYAGYGSHPSGILDQPAAVFSQEDPLFGALPSADTTAVGYDAHAYDAYNVQSAYQAPYDPGSCGPVGQWEVPAHGVLGIPDQPGPAASDGIVMSGQWDTARSADSAQPWTDASYAAAGADAFAQAMTWDQGAYADLGSSIGFPGSPDSLSSPAEEWHGEASYDPAPGTEPERTGVLEPASEDCEDFETTPAAAAGRPPEPRRATGGRNRRARARRSALLTVALPSVAVIGMAGVAAASVNGLGDTTPQAASATPPGAPAVANSELDTRLASLTASADDFADRASRTQERIDLTQRRQEDENRREAEAARKKAEAARKKAEAASKEALRPKFALPVAQKGVGELFGAAGSMWSNRHTGLDFPVPMNTPVMAVTDGTVTSKWNQAYGNMVIVTAPDGTETWYCHLASAKIRSGSVKAGDVIAYAGSTGNSSGPHLHLEVHPGGGAAVDPLRWLRGHGLDPT